MTGPSGGPHPPKASGRGYPDGQQSRSSNQRSVTLTDLWCWLGERGVPRSEIDGKPTEFLLDLYKQKSSRSGEQKPNRES